MGNLAARSERLIHKATQHQEAAGEVLKRKPHCAEHSISWSAQSCQIVPAEHIDRLRKAEHSLAHANHGTACGNGGAMLGSDVRFLMEKIYVGHGLRSKNKQVTKSLKQWSRSRMNILCESIPLTE